MTIGSGLLPSRTQQPRSAAGFGAVSGAGGGLPGRSSRAFPVVLGRAQMPGRAVVHFSSALIYNENALFLNDPPVQNVLNVQ